MSKETVCKQATERKEFTKAIKSMTNEMTFKRSITLKNGKFRIAEETQLIMPISPDKELC